MVAPPLKPCRIHITGASGSGVTTLGRALAQRLAFAHHDTDDYYWLPTSPPYMQKRPVEDRLRLMREMFLDRSDWILSGALESWGAPIVPYLDLVVFLFTPTSVRLDRLRDREARHFGERSVAPGGWRYDECEAFIDWASGYDGGRYDGRSLPRQRAWLKTLACPVLELDGTRKCDDLVQVIVASLQR